MKEKLLKEHKQLKCTCDRFQSFEPMENTILKHKHSVSKLKTQNVSTK